VTEAEQRLIAQRNLLSSSEVIQETTSANILPPSQRMLTDEQLARSITADIGDSLQQLSQSWPALPEYAAQRFYDLRDEITDDIKQHAAVRYRMRYGNDGKSIPPAPVLLWEHDLFQVALHTELTRLSANPITTGFSSSATEDNLLITLLPNTRLHLSLRASRIPRPPWPELKTLHDGVGLLPLVSQDDPAFTGWTRLAIIEHHYVSQMSQPYAPPSEVITLYAGAVVVRLTGINVIPVGALPFSQVDVNTWWRNPQDPPVRFRLPVGPIVGINRETDWLGDTLVLIPPIQLKDHLMLKSSGYGEPLIWSDATGAPAVVVRTWRLRNDRNLYSDTSESEGMDLIVRPDIMQQLLQWSGVPIREVRILSTQTLS